MSKKINQINKKIEESNSFSLLNSENKNENNETNSINKNFINFSEKKEIFNENKLNNNNSKKYYSISNKKFKEKINEMFIKKLIDENKLKKHKTKIKLNNNEPIIIKSSSESEISNNNSMTINSEINTNNSKTFIQIEESEESENEIYFSNENLKTYLSNEGNSDSIIYYYFEIIKIPFEKNYSGFFDFDNFFENFIRCNINLIENEGNFSLKLNFINLKKTKNFCLNLSISLKYFNFSKNKFFRCFTEDVKITNSNKTDENKFINILNKNNFFSYKNEKIIFRLEISKSFLNEKENEKIKNQIKKLNKIGIINEGNTCYMNSIIQSLYNLPFIRLKIFSSNTKNLNTKSKNKSHLFNKEERNKIVYELQKIFFNLHSTQNKKFIRINNFFPKFNWEKSFWNVPQDAAEIYSIIYECVSEDIKEIKENCEGILERIIKVESKKYESKKDEQFFFLSLEIEENENLIDCIETFLKEEHLTDDNKYLYENPNSLDKTFVDAKKSYEIKKLPNILFIQLKRFKYDKKENKFIKLNNYIKYDYKMNLNQFLKSKEKKQNENYVLYSVIIHIGTLDNGHYFTFCNDLKSNLWIKLNDSHINISNNHEVFNDNFGGVYTDFEYDFNKKKIISFDVEKERNAYILIYVKENKIDDFFETSNEEVYIKNIQKEIEDEINNNNNINININNNNNNNFDDSNKDDVEMKDFKNNFKEIENIANKINNNNNNNENSYNKNIFKFKDKINSNNLNSKNFNLNNIFDINLKQNNSKKINKINIDKNNIKIFFSKNNLIETKQITLKKNKTTKTVMDLINIFNESENEKYNPIDLLLIKCNKIGIFIEILDCSEKLDELLISNENGNIFLIIYFIENNQSADIYLDNINKITTINFYESFFLKSQNKQKLFIENNEKNNVLNFLFPILILDKNCTKDINQLKEKITNVSEKLLNQYNQQNNKNKLFKFNQKFKYINNNENNLKDISFSNIKISNVYEQREILFTSYFNNPDTRACRIIVELENDN